MLSTSCTWGWTQPTPCLISKCNQMPSIHIFINSESALSLPGRFTKQHDFFFCPPPPVHGVKGEECGVDNVLSALGVGYSKALHYTIAASSTSAVLTED